MSFTGGRKWKVKLLNIFVLFLLIIFSPFIFYLFPKWQLLKTEQEFFKKYWKLYLRKVTFIIKVIWKHSVSYVSSTVSLSHMDWGLWRQQIPREKKNPMQLVEDLLDIHQSTDSGDFWQLLVQVAKNEADSKEWGRWNQDVCVCLLHWLGFHLLSGTQKKTLGIVRRPVR